MNRDAYESLYFHHREGLLRHQVVVPAYCRILRAAPYVTSAYALKTFPFQMHLLQIRGHRDLHLDDLDRRDVELHLLMDLLNDMDQKLVHLHHLDVE